MFVTDPFIVAEISANHLGSFDNALKLVMSAKEAGADAVKFQTYTPEEMAMNGVIINGPWAGRTYHDLYREGMTPWEWHRPLFQLARDIGLFPFSSPFSVDAVNRLESLDCQIYKIASPEIRHHQLIAAAAETGKDLIISTGMAELSEICDAEQIAVSNGARTIIFLHCISAYPAAVADFNLNTLSRLAHHGFTTGLSDHSLDNTAAIAAVALGAVVVEKHLCLSRSLGGPDAAFSLEPHEFKALVQSCKAARAAMGQVAFGCRESEWSSYKHRRSIWLVKGIKKGQKLTEDHIAILRPNYGLDPYEWDNIIGKTMRISVSAGTAMSWDFLK